jgi:transcriptional regulator with XRE-family HTH domain
VANTKLSHGRGTGIPSPVDVHVGARLCQRRTVLGMSQTKLGDAVGVSFQQIQKYERGDNRLSASRLFSLSRVLDVPVEFFFEEMPTAVAASAPGLGGTVAKEPSSHEPGLMTKRETLKLLRAYYEIKDPTVRKRLHEVAMALGAAASKDD